MQSALALPRPSDQWIATDLGLYIPSGFWPNVPKALRREIRFGRVEEAFRELKELLGIGAKAITENPLIGGTASEKSNAVAFNYTTGAFTATAGSVQVAVVLANKAFGAASVPTASGWTQWATLSVSSYSITGFWAQVSGSTTIPFVFGAQRDAVIWTVQEFANCDPTTPINTNVITASGTSTTPTATLPNAFANANSGVFAADGLSIDTVAHTAGSGFNLIYDSGNTVSFSNERLASEWKNNNDSTPDFTIASSQTWSLIACELVGLAAKSESFRSPAVRVAQQLISHWRRQ